MKESCRRDFRRPWHRGTSCSHQTEFGRREGATYRLVDENDHPTRSFRSHHEPFSPDLSQPTSLHRSPSPSSITDRVLPLQLLSPSSSPPRNILPSPIPILTTIFEQSLPFTLLIFLMHRHRHHAPLLLLIHQSTSRLFPFQSGLQFMCSSIRDDSFRTGLRTIAGGKSDWGRGSREVGGELVLGIGW